MRVSIARGLVTEPDLLLMDEPFGALDEITRHKLDAELLELWSKKKLTVIFVTHSLHEAVFLSSRVVMMAAQAGRVWWRSSRIDAPYPRHCRLHARPLSSARHAQQLQDRACCAPVPMVEETVCHERPLPCFAFPMMRLPGNAERKQVGTRPARVPVATVKSAARRACPSWLLQPQACSAYFCRLLVGLVLHCCSGRPW